jgi:hypothetical protein
MFAVNSHPFPHSISGPLLASGLLLSLIAPNTSMVVVLVRAMTVITSSASHLEFQLIWSRNVSRFIEDW